MRVQKAMLARLIAAKFVQQQPLATRRLATVCRKPMPSPVETFNYSFLKVSAVLLFSIYLGSTVARAGAALLEENEIFIHEDDDDDD
uniref:Essential MCU regulator, mitochondrial n=1 Tax=Panagrellus redivivus TaxID=6233 RepID=A0A7E4W0H4_PANRE